MTKPKKIMLIAIILASVAGIAAGWQLNDGCKHGKHRTEYIPSWLNEELNLNPDQLATLRDIWVEKSKGHGRNQTHNLSQEKDKKVLAILTDEQKPQYEAIMDEFRKAKKEAEEQSQFDHETAIEATMEILNEEQQVKFQELVETHKNHGRLPMIHGKHHKDKKGRH